MVVASMESACKQSNCLVNGDDLKASNRQPANLLLDFVCRPALVADEHVEHLADVDRADARRIVSVAQERLNFDGGRFPCQGRHDRLRVENAQLRPLCSSTADSSSCTIVRTSSVFGLRPRIDPIAAPIGSSGIGLMTMALPRSSIATRLVRQRCRISAGTETWPPFEIVVILMRRD
jgi:hypothetical protein